MSSFFRGFPPFTQTTARHHVPNKATTGNKPPSRTDKHVERTKVKLIRLAKEQKGFSNTLDDKNKAKTMKLMARLDPNQAMQIIQHFTNNNDYDYDYDYDSVDEAYDSVDDQDMEAKELLNKTFQLYQSNANTVISIYLKQKMVTSHPLSNEHFNHPDNIISVKSAINLFENNRNLINTGELEVSPEDIQDLLERLHKILTLISIVSDYTAKGGIDPVGGNPNPPPKKTNSIGSFRVFYNSLSSDNQLALLKNENPTVKQLLQEINQAGS